VLQGREKSAEALEYL